LNQRAKLLESKAKLIPHTNFMAAPKIPKKKRNLLMVLALWNCDSWGKSLQRKICKKSIIS
jgi:hypothetical protein